jgi:hypothetical protein
MLTRGHFIGQIIDELTLISEQVKNRSRLGLNDLSKYSEDFMKDVLNITLDYELDNLNSDRCNFPGLDLGDKKKGVGFQITATKTSDKINATLEKASLLQSTFPAITVFILQEKQASYTIDPDKAAPFNFTEQNIWDFNDLFKRIMSLRIDVLQKLFTLITANVARVRVDLETPDTSGTYSTEMANFIESIPTECYKGVASLHEHLCANCGAIDIKRVEEDIRSLITTLKALPRITCQFYAMLLDRGEWDDERRKINYDYLTRICSYSDWEGEVRLLTQAGLCYFREPDDPTESGYFYVYPRKGKPCHNYYLYELVAYMTKNNLSFKTVMAVLDFSGMA